MTMKTIIFVAVTSLTVFAQETIHMHRNKNEPPYFKTIQGSGYLIKTTRALGSYIIRYRPFVMFDNYYAETSMDVVKTKLKKSTSMSS